MDKVKSILKDRHYVTISGVFVAVFLAFSLYNPGYFLSASNFESMSWQFPEYGVLTLGIMLAMISGGIDLSSMSIANLSAIVAGRIMHYIVDGTVDPKYTLVIVIIGIFAALLVGTASGYLNGNLVSRIGVPPMLATMGSMQLFKGISIVITRGAPISGMPPMFATIGTVKVFGVFPIALIVFALCVALVTFLLKKTAYGAEIFMVGANRKAAQYSGVNDIKVLNTTYTLSGFLSGIIGVIMLANYNSIRADYGTSYVLQCILIVRLGAGEQGKIGCVVLSILIIQMISTGLNLILGTNIFLKDIILGVLLIVMLLIESDNLPSFKRLFARTKKIEV